MREYCERRGWEISAEFTDVGVSGAKERRPQLDQLIAGCRKRWFDAVVVYRYDRFARSLRQLVNALGEFDALGIQFVSLHEGVDTSTPNGRLVFGIFATIADYAEHEIMQSDRAGGRVFSALQRCGTPHHPRSCRDAINASGALNRPRRNSGGRTDSIASSFSDGSTRT